VHLSIVRKKNSDVELFFFFKNNHVGTHVGAHVGAHVGTENPKIDFPYMGLKMIRMI
jgi:hypothetical protein